jgi:branched-chain amino acid transport system substrate-binding protein
VILGFTGPIESITPAHGRWRRAGDGRSHRKRRLLDGMIRDSVRADSTCIDSAAANAAAERLITSDNVTASWAPTVRA